MDKVQQTIVMRSKFPDGTGTKKLRSGKYCAQASHASIAFLSHKFHNVENNKISGINNRGEFYEEFIDAPKSLTDEEKIWINEAFTKIVLYVETEQELLDIYNRAKDEELTVHLITDSGLTEFNGAPTNTCLAIGPHWKSKIDPITKDLRLF